MAKTTKERGILFQIKEEEDNVNKYQELLDNADAEGKDKYDWREWSRELQVSKWRLASLKKKL